MEDSKKLSIVAAVILMLGMLTAITIAALPSMSLEARESSDLNSFCQSNGFERMSRIDSKIYCIRREWIQEIESKNGHPLKNAKGMYYFID